MLRRNAAVTTVRPAALTTDAPTPRRNSPGIPGAGSVLRAISSNEPERSDHIPTLSRLGTEAVGVTDPSKATLPISSRSGGPRWSNVEPAGNPGAGAPVSATMRKATVAPARGARHAAHIAVATADENSKKRRTIGLFGSCIYYSSRRGKSCITGAPRGAANSTSRRTCLSRHGQVSRRNLLEFSSQID